MFLAGCEYKLDEENYREIEKPPATHPFNLSLIPEGDTIKLFMETEFLYDFDTYGLEIQGGIFKLQGKTWNEYSENGKFFLSPDDFTPGIDTLTLELYSKTGSGSIADQLDAESYLVVKKWLVIIDNRPAPEFNATYSLTSEGYLKISWPECEQFNFNYYLVRGVINSDYALYEQLYHAKRNSYVDSCYIGGSMRASVDLFVKGDCYPSSTGDIFEINEPAPELKFEELGVDSLRLFWSRSKFHAHYKLTSYNTSPLEVYLESDTDTSYTMASPGFGNNRYFELSTSPIIASPKAALYTQKKMYNYSLGTSFLPNWPRYAYSSMDNVVYSNSYSKVNGYDPASLAIVGSVYIDGIDYAGLYSCPSNSTKIAALSKDKILVFDNRQLKNPVSIPLDWGWMADYFCLTNNDVIAVAKTGIYKQIRVSDQQEVASFAIPDYPVYSKWACITTSNDGEYACVVTKNGCVINKINNGAVTQVYTDARVYRSALFNETKNRELYLTFYENNTLEVRDPSDFSLKRTINLPTSKEVLCNTDPVSGYLMLTDYENLYILDMVNSKLKLKIKCTDFIPRLYGNRLFSNSGYTFDISKFLRK
jgi:hypothetical protein